MQAARGPALIAPLCEVVQHLSALCCQPFAAAVSGVDISPITQRPKCRRTWRHCMTSLPLSRLSRAAIAGAALPGCKGYSAASSCFCAVEMKPPDWRDQSSA